MKKALYFVLIVASISAIAQGAESITPRDAVKQMGSGINIGNTLDPQDEGAWNNPQVQEYYFDDYKKAGFNSVKIPITWDEHAGKTAPYTINEKWLNRVEQIVDWGLSRDLFIVIDAHHEAWIKDNYKDQAQRDRFDSIWRQISKRFKDKSPKLIFEIINEPNGLSKEETDDLNLRILKIIRETTPTRLVIISGTESSGPDQLINTAVPKDDYIIGTFHMFEPADFARNGQGTWGSEDDKKALKETFDKVAKWSQENKIPVLLGDFGVVAQANADSRKAFYAAMVAEASAHGFPYIAWDDGADFQIYKRAERAWNELKDILIKTPASPPAAP